MGLHLPILTVPDGITVVTTISLLKRTTNVVITQPARRKVVNANVIAKTGLKEMGSLVSKQRIATNSFWLGSTTTVFTPFLLLVGRIPVFKSTVRCPQKEEVGR